MKKMIFAVMAAAFILSSTMVMAASVRCTVDNVDGNKVTVTCTKADTLKAGQDVLVKAKQKKAYEGC